MTIKRINEFPEGSGVLSSDDIFLVMDDPSGSAQTKKVSLSTLSSVLGGGGGGGNSVVSNTALVPNSYQITNMVSISQADYDALETKDSQTLYIITS